LLGHSWGSALGLTLVQRHPDWFYAYLGVGQVINTRKSEAEGYEWALSEARAHHNADAERELTSLAPYPGDGPISIERIAVDRKWLQYFGGLTFGRTDFTYDAGAWMLSPDYSDKDLDAIGAGSGFSLNYLLPTLTDFDFDQTDHIRCPVFLFVGRHDYTTSHTLAQQWFKRLHAPSKKLVMFDNSAHMVMQEEPGRFLFHLITDLRPIAIKAGDGPAD